MRLTVNLDEDLYRITKSLALAEDISISSAVNGLLRRNLEGPGHGKRTKGQRFPVVRCRENRVITSEEIQRLIEEDDA